MRILAFDIATKTGWAFGEKEPEAGGSFKFKGFYLYYRQCEDLIELWKPEIIIVAEATRFFTAQRRMNMLCGAMQVAADNKGVSLYIEQRQGKGKKKASSGFPIDSHIKKTVFGEGKVSKEQICQRYNVTDEDEADARMFVEYLIIKNNG